MRPKDFCSRFFCSDELFWQFGLQFLGQNTDGSAKNLILKHRCKSDFCNSMIGRSQQIGSRLGNSLSLFLPLLSTNISK